MCLFIDETSQVRHPGIALVGRSQVLPASSQKYCVGRGTDAKKNNRSFHLRLRLAITPVSCTSVERNTSSWWPFERHAALPEARDSNTPSNWMTGGPPFTQAANLDSWLIRNTPRLNWKSSSYEGRVVHQLSYTLLDRVLSRQRNVRNQIVPSSGSLVDFGGEDC